MSVGFCDPGSAVAACCISTTPPCAGKTCEASFDQVREEMRSTGEGGVELLLLPHTLPVVDAAVVVVSTFHAFEAERGTKSRCLGTLCRRRRCCLLQVAVVVDEMSAAWADLESGQRFESRHCKV